MDKNKIISIILLIFILSLALGIGLFFSYTSILEVNNKETFVAIRNTIDNQDKIDPVIISEQLQGLYLYMRILYKLNIISAEFEYHINNLYNNLNLYNLAGNISLTNICDNDSKCISKNMINLNDIKIQNIFNENNCDFYYTLVNNVITCNYNIKNGDDFKDFIKRLYYSLTEHSSSNLKNKSISLEYYDYNYDSDNSFVEKIEIMYVYTFVPIALYNMYIIDYNTFVEIYSSAFQSYYDYIIFTQMYNSAKQMNIPLIDVTDKNGTVLLYVDLKNNSHGDANTFIDNIIYIFDSTEITKVLEPSYILFYNCLLYFVKKYNIIPHNPYSKPPPPTLKPTTLKPTSLKPTTLQPTTLKPTTLQPTTLQPTTLQPTTLKPTISDIWRPIIKENMAYYRITMSDDGTIVAACVNNGGICISTNSGQTWKQTNAQSNNWTDIKISGNGKKLFACAYGGYVWVSNDSGNSWETLTYQMNYNVNWYRLTVSNDGSTVATIIYNDGIYVPYTTAGTTLWKKTTTGYVGWICITMSSNGTKLAACKSYDGIYISSDSGLTWTKSSAPTANWKSITMSSDGSKLAACIMNGNIYTSSDSGTTWTETSAISSSCMDIKCSSDGNNLVAYEYSGGIYRSIDFGSTWIKTSAPNGNFPKQWYGITCSSDGKIIFACNFDNIYTNSNISSTSLEKNTINYTELAKIEANKNAVNDAKQRAIDDANRKIDISGNYFALQVANQNATQKANDAACNDARTKANLDAVKQANYAVLNKNMHIQFSGINVTINNGDVTINTGYGESLPVGSYKQTNVYGEYNSNIICNTGTASYSKNTIDGSVYGFDGNLITVKNDNSGTISDGSSSSNGKSYTANNGSGSSTTTCTITNGVGSNNNAQTLAAVYFYTYNYLIPIDANDCSTNNKNSCSMVYYLNSDYSNKYKHAYQFLFERNDTLYINSSNKFVYVVQNIYRDGFESIGTYVNTDNLNGAHLTIKVGKDVSVELFYMVNIYKSLNKINLPDSNCYKVLLTIYSDDAQPPL